VYNKYIYILICHITLVDRINQKLEKLNCNKKREKKKRYYIQDFNKLHTTQLKLHATNIYTFYFYLYTYISILIMYIITKN